MWSVVHRPYNVSSEWKNHNTLSVKRNITSSEWRSSKSTASKLLIFGHRFGKLILNKYIFKKKTFLQNCDEIARGQFFKITEITCLSGWEFEADNSPYGVYVTCHWNWVNSYWMFWIGRLRGARSMSSFCEFRKMTLRNLTTFSPFLSEKISCFSDILIKNY